MDTEVEVKTTEEGSVEYRNQSLFEKLFVTIAEFIKLILSYALTFYGLYLIYKSFAGGEAWLLEGEFEGKISDGIIAIIVVAIAIWLFDFLFNFIIALALLPISFVISLKNRSRNNRQTEKLIILYGFGGWLILFAIGLMFVLFSSVTNLFDYYIPLYQSQEFRDIVQNSPMIGMNVFLETLALLLGVLFPLVIGFACLKQSKWFPRLSIAYLSIRLVLAIVFFFSTQLIYDINSPALDTVIPNLVYNFIYFVIWVPYFLRSKRIRNTYIA
ncbi:DUF2569 domain-containing protein [Paenibacillus lutrae]|uniref:DUF2569 family protein n=1 Tax=Paenibacillus lutrae TaxID=2078573 RepID=A0A7X3FIS1_9BACL|nr:DUF2569 domain-containing protein [Paenibacillus lutrae]MVP00393.1 DUF2569 family protein [Paenibacillus lutrae]